MAQLDDYKLVGGYCTAYSDFCFGHMICTKYFHRECNKEFCNWNWSSNFKFNFFPQSMVLGQKTIITSSLKLISSHKLHFRGSYEQIY